MTPTEQGHSSLSITSPIIKSPDVDDRLSSEMYGHYSAPATTHMMMNKTYSPVPGVQDNGALYSSPSYNQYGPGAPHQPAIIPSPQFIHSNLGSPSPSVTSAYSNQHQHYTNSSNYPLNSSQPPQQSTHPTLRTVYLGNIASDTQISDILDQVRTGNIEMARPFPEKNCLFLTFVDASAAAHFYYQVSNRPFTINGVELKIGWGKPSAMPANIRLALQNGASRNVFLGSLDESVNEDVIREDLKRFGTIEHVRLIREKNIAFVHFLSIANAIKCVNSLPTEGDWQNRRVYYGKDRCCQVANNGASSLASNSTTTPMYPNTALSAYAPLPPHHPHYHSHSLHHQPIHVQHHTYQVRYSPSITYDPYTGATIETYTTASPSSAVAPLSLPTHQHQRPPHPPVIPTTLPSAQSPIAAVPPTASTPHQHDHQHHHLHPHPTATMVPALPPLHGEMALYHPHHQHQHTHPAAGNDVGGHSSLTGVANRTIYLGNIHPDTTCEEICNVIRGGILSQIRYMVDKHIAFIAFVDPVLALSFYTQASYHGIVIKSRRLKIGWGKPSSLPGNVIQAVQNGGSRNVYLGNMEEESMMTEEKLLQDFSEYGDIELVNTLKEKNCAFVNFTSIAAAIRAIDGIRTKEEYKRFRINFGKDRCGNPPRSLLQQQQQQQGMATAATTESMPSPPTTTNVTTAESSSSSLVVPANGIPPPPLPNQTSHSTSTTTDQELLLLNSSAPPSTLDLIDPATVAAALTTTTNMDVSSLADLMVPSSTLRLPPSDGDDQVGTNGVLNPVIHH